MQRHESTAFDPQLMRPNDVYHLLNAVVVPRPIAWVSTLSDRGVANLAPHSYFTVLAPDLVATGNVHINGEKTRA